MYIYSAVCENGTTVQEANLKDEHSGLVWPPASFKPGVQIPEAPYALSVRQTAMHPEGGGSAVCDAQSCK